MKRDPPILLNTSHFWPSWLSVPWGCRADQPGTVRAAGVKAVSPAKRGRSEATRLDAGEHTVMLMGPDSAGS